MNKELMSEFSKSAFWALTISTAMFGIGSTIGMLFVHGSLEGTLISYVVDILFFPVVLLSLTEPYRMLSSVGQDILALVSMFVGYFIVILGLRWLHRKHGSNHI